MRRTLFTALALLVAASVALAQTKFETKWHCSKEATSHSIDVGDVPGHSYMIMQGTCSATSPSKSFAEKIGTYTEFHDNWKATYNGHGYYNVTMDNGDMVYYTYETKDNSNDPSKPKHNTWKIVSATGKHKGSAGSGSCTGKDSADGSSDWTCTGTVTPGK